MSKVTDLKQAQQTIKSIQPLSSGGATELMKAVQQALAVAGPVGSPETIRDRAKDYAKAAKAYAKASADLGTVATAKLPSVWTGAVAEHASQAVQALANELDVSKKTLELAASWLNFWAGELETARSQDVAGVGLLERALKSIAFSPFAAAGLQDALDGVSWRVSGAEHAENGGTRTASMLNQFATRARTERAGAGKFDPLAALVLANEKGPGGKADGDYILTPDQLSRANVYLAGLNATDQAAFQGLVSGAKSPEEAAYLWKALAAGHSMTEVQQFAALIHPHGDDPVWLSQHLVPALRTDSAAQESTTETVSLVYRGETVPNSARNILGDIEGTYSQGSVGDCVAASTVVAHLKLDPVTMLQVTTGNTPDAPGADSKSNFERRLQELYIQRYQQGQLADGGQAYPQVDKGLSDKGTRLVIAENLGKATGDTYENVSLKSDDDRRAALVRIEKAVDEGKPVPFSVGDGTGFHEMVITARDGNRLQVYNPWGRSEWVTEDQFIHSQMNAGHITDNSNLNTAYGAELPK
ncbi:hypothetical protein ACH4E7_29650 [Kitasatospora sp. NPDC018058]|uniref:hypothetical protein n=1 Tax=Kitasatospora sp. NPDC018058 TaxID=3364025 RepID=UPI0037C0CEB1